MRAPPGGPALFMPYPSCSCQSPPHMLWASPVQLQQLNVKVTTMACHLQKDSTPTIAKINECQKAPSPRICHHIRSRTSTVTMLLPRTTCGPHSINVSDVIRDLSGDPIVHVDEYAQSCTCRANDPLSPFHATEQKLYCTMSLDVNMANERFSR